jgi:DNA-binding MarR family transcriptional regulator
VSLAAYLWAWQQGASGTPLLVLLYLADCHNTERRDSIFPSARTIATRCGISRATVMRALNDLEESGTVERVSRPGHSSVYRLVGCLSLRQVGEARVAQVETLGGSDCGGVVSHCETQNQERNQEGTPERAREERERQNGWPGANVDDARQSIRFLLEDLGLSPGDRAGFTRALDECSTMPEVYHVRDQAREAAGPRSVG